MSVIAQKSEPTTGYLRSLGIKVVLKGPSGGLGAGQCPAPGLPGGHVSSTSVPHELKYPILGTLFCAVVSVEVGGSPSFFSGFRLVVDRFQGLRFRGGGLAHRFHIVAVCHEDASYDEPYDAS